MRNLTKKNEKFTGTEEWIILKKWLLDGAPVKMV